MKNRPITKGQQRVLKKKRKTTNLSAIQIMGVNLSILGCAANMFHVTKVDNCRKACQKKSAKCHDFYLGITEEFRKSGPGKLTSLLHVEKTIGCDTIYIA
jgi:hypothetical protein